MYPPIEELLTHRGDMLLIERVLDSGPEGIRVEAKVDGNAWYADTEGAMPAWIGIELMAQAIAALVGLKAREQRLPPRQGLLLGTRSFTTSVPAFAQHATLLVAASEVFQEDNGLAAFDARIELAGRTVAEATLKVFEPADFKAIVEQEK
ncbi:MAG: beta-hydroxyacyl-ACP dehydratase [Pseudomonadota bacterium]|nr:beta-hydroxyacyl-ACP dehydratase [Pseudomonadota bacterium]MDP1903225.1 beta-hydroxyacyl-ACP dehydratase [Pseudomonadota bacterium]MDP2352734.1 beta-hydroxyacyl-ACP dehydratase [Pseudomonadota bacterium]